jgi:hypothetical protein
VRGSGGRNRPRGAWRSQTAYDAPAARQASNELVEETLERVGATGANRPGEALALGEVDRLCGPLARDLLVEVWSHHHVSPSCPQDVSARRHLPRKRKKARSASLFAG